MLKALRVGDHLRAEDIAPYNEHVRGFVLDTYQKGMIGGTGKSFDWSIIDRLGLKKTCILAGGLDVDNVVTAIQFVHPYAVDVNSGVEKRPGIKDHTLMRTFVDRIRRLDRQ